MDLLEALQGEYTKAEAEQLIADMKVEVLNGANPEDLLYELGYEPDYIFDILPY